MAAVVRVMQLALVLRIALAKYVVAMAVEVVAVPVVLGHALMEPVFLLVVAISLALVLLTVELAIYVQVRGRVDVLLARRVLTVHVFLPVPLIVAVKLAEIMAAVVAAVHVQLEQIVLMACAFLPLLHAPLIKLVLRMVAPG